MFCTDFTHGRGCIIYVKSTIPASCVNIGVDFLESVWCRIDLTGSDKLLLGCVYRSPNSTMENNQELLNLFARISETNLSHVLIMGDFNVKEIDWKTNFSSTNMNETHFASLFLESVRDSFLYQHVREFTRYRAGDEPSVLDLLFTNEENMINTINYKPGLGKSDHLQLEFSFNCYTEIVQDHFKKYNFFKGNYGGCSSKLSSVNWKQVFNGLNLAASWETLTETISNLVETYIPVSKVSSETGKKTPYITQSCHDAIRAKHTKWEKYIHCKTSPNYEMYKQSRNRVTTEMRRSKYEYERNLATKIKTDTKLFWSYIRSNLKTKSKLSQLEKHDGTLTNDSQEKAEVLNQYFASVFEKEGPEALPEFHDRTFTESLDTININENLVGKAVDKLKPSKSQGPDNIHPKLIKECKNSIVPPLTIIFEKSLKETELPQIWKQANVTAIYKKGDKTKPENYRPISLTSVPCKLMERLIRDELVEHMSRNNFFSPFQHGFISGKSCVTQLLEFLDEITEALDQGEDIDIIYLDFSKAFDKVPHKRLMKKLWGYGIRGKIHKWIQEFLNCRTQRVVVNGKFSSSEQVTSGIPQGSVLGPILFVIFINDLPDAIQCCIKLFADDSKIYRRVTNNDHVQSLQASLNSAILWAERWNMFFNLKKCHHLHIGKHSINQSYVMQTQEGITTIENVDSEKDLGVTIDKALSFGEHISSKIGTYLSNLYLHRQGNLFKSVQIYCSPPS
ncbi:MAG: reverse transcriptase domain-containing protein [Candidatus Thiodiazotropha sp.]